MFSRTARYYDLIYSFKDYAVEAEKIAALIKRESPDARTILDVACGTAEHARLLSEQFEVDGIDLEPKFIEIAKEKVSSGEFWLADMRISACLKAMTWFSVYLAQSATCRMKRRLSLL